MFLLHLNSRTGDGRRKVVLRPLRTMSTLGEDKVIRGKGDIAEEDTDA